jgi:hypothetical protein
LSGQGVGTKKTVLTVGLFVAGQLLGAEVRIDDGGVDCGRTAESIAADNGATLVGWRCVLEQGV